MADNSSKYSTRGFGTKATYDLKSPNKEQTAIVYDLLAEGPIAGLSNESTETPLGRISPFGIWIFRHF